MRDAALIVGLLLAAGFFGALCLVAREMGQYGG